MVCTGRGIAEAIYVCRREWRDPASEIFPKTKSTDQEWIILQHIPDHTDLFYLSALYQQGIPVFSPYLCGAVDPDRTFMLGEKTAHIKLEQ